MILKDFVKDRIALFKVLLDGKCTLKRNDYGLWATPCPLCMSETCSLVINHDKSSFYCEECFETGDVITFLCKFSHCSRSEAEKYLIQRYGLSTSRIKMHLRKNACSGEQDHVTLGGEISP